MRGVAPIFTPDRYYERRIVLAHKTTNEIAEEVERACIITRHPIVRIFNRRGEIMTAIDNYSHRTLNLANDNVDLIDIRRKQYDFETFLSNIDVRIQLSNACIQFSQCPRSIIKEIREEICSRHDSKPEFLTSLGYDIDFTQFKGTGGLKLYQNYISDVLKERNNYVHYHEASHITKRQLLEYLLNNFQGEAVGIEKWVAKYWLSHEKQCAKSKENRREYFDKSRIIADITETYTREIAYIKNELLTNPNLSTLL